MKTKTFVYSFYFPSGILTFAYWMACLAPTAWAYQGLRISAPENQEEMQVTIPGPLRPFLRMAAISQGVSPDEVLPLLARNVATRGYTYGPHGALRPTEYLLLLKGYVQQARELHSLAGRYGVIHIASCSEAAPLLKALGYSANQPCGPSTLLDIVDPKKVFLTLDSGFPLTSLEMALQKGKPFSYDFPATKVPTLVDPHYLPANRHDVLDSLMDDPVLARLYAALSRLEEDTRALLLQSVGLQELLHLAPAIDFYGSQLSIRAGRVSVPGGGTATPSWTKLVGAGPDSPAEFVTRLLEKDGGWLAAYFDTLARIPRLNQDYFTEPRRIVTFYRALRGRDLSPSPTVGIYRMAAGLYLLTTRLQLDPDGRPHIPGGLEVWKNILQERRQNHHIREWARRSRDWKEPDQLIEAMFAFSRMYQKDSPLRVYWSLSEMDRRRPTDQHLSPQLVHLLARNFPRYGDQYTILTEWSSLDEKSITRFIEVAQSVDNIRDTALRANAIGIFQANVGLWEILARQDEIRHLSLNESWQQMIQPFFDVKSSERLVDAARASLSVLFTASTGGSRVSQEGLIALLAAPVPSSNARQRMRQMLADRMRSVMDAQELASLDTIFALADGLSDMAKGKDVPTEALLRRANELRQFETPKPILSNRERSALALGGLSNPHAVLQSRADFSHLFKQPAGPPVELAKARGLLAPFLRDTLVGLNYAYYEPPGSQVLHTNPLFVRLHDFGMQLGTAKSTAWEEPHLVDRGGTPIGGAHLEGSLAGLPLVLASVEEEFLVPDDIQALIWEDMVPNLLTGAVLPRWWRVTREEIHAAALYQRFGEELLAAAAEDAPLRQTLLDILSERMHPTMLDHLSRALSAAQLPEVWPQLIPTDTFFLGAEFLRRLPDEASHRGSAGTELGALLKRAPQVTSLERISRDFGIPHPALADTYACELLDIKPLPSFLGYSARLLAESWESNNLYWARLADEKGYDPVLLHVLVPALTQRMVEKISGTHLEDWPSIMRALHETGEEFRAGKINFQEETGSNLEPRESHVIPR